MASSSSLRQNSSNRCVFCWKPATQRCVNCKKASQQQVFYCSNKCQRKDWADHKHFCSLPFPKKELEHSVYAILLREEATRPEVVEIASRSYGYDNIQKFIPDPSTPMYVTTNYYKDINGNFPKNSRDARRLGDMLLIQYNDCFLFDGSAPNKCIKTFMDGNNPPHPWAGPVIVYKKLGNNGNYDARCMDIELADGADIVAQFRYYGSEYNNRISGIF